MFPISNDYDTACNILQLDIIKKKYRELSMLYHPDKYNEDKGRVLQSESMKCINKAYEYILDYLKNIDDIKKRCNIYSKLYTMKDYCNEWHYKSNFKQSIITSYEMRKRKKDNNIKCKIIFEKISDNNIDITLPVLDKFIFEIMNKFNMFKGKYNKIPDNININSDLDKLKLGKIIDNIIFIYNMSYKEELKLKKYLYYITLISL